MARLVLHKTFAISYLVGGVSLFILTATFRPSDRKSDCLFGITLAFIAGYFLLLGIFLAARAVHMFSDSLHIPAVLVASLAAVLLFFSMQGGLTAYHMLFHAAEAPNRPPNPAASGNGGIAPLFHIDRLGRAVSEPPRWPTPNT